MVKGMRISSDAVGLQIAQSHLTAVRLVQRDDTLHPLVVAEAGLPRGTLDQDGRITSDEQIGQLAQAIRALWRSAKLKTRRVFLALDLAAITLQTLELPALPDDELRSAVELEICPSLGLSRDEVRVDFAVRSRLEAGEAGTDRPSGYTRVLAAACDKQVPTQFLRVAQQARLTVLDIEPAPIVLTRALHLLSEGSELILDIGLLRSTAILLHDGVVERVESLPVGADDFTQALIELGHQPKHAEQFKRRHSLIAPDEHDPYPAERAALIGVAAELVDALYPILDWNPADTTIEPQRLLLCGGGAKLSGLAGHLNASLGLPVELADPVPGLEVDDLELFPRQALAYGLAMHPQMEEP